MLTNCTVMNTGWFRTAVASSLLFLPLIARADNSVAIVNPTNGSVFVKPVSVLIQADVTTSSVSNNILRVNFHAASSNATVIGTLLGSQMAPDAGGLYDWTWTNPPAGTFALTAVAVDFMEHRATSAPVLVTIKTNSDNVIPVVTVFATDPTATKSGSDIGTFTLYRTGPTSNSLTVFFGMGGTATNGADYVTISNSVTFNPGDTSENIILQPINNPNDKGDRTAVLQLLALPGYPPVTYSIGDPHTATVTIIDDVTPPPTNIPPSVHIYTPTNHSVFFAPANIFIGAEAVDKDGYVATVEFFENGISLGVKTNNPLAMNAINPFFINWTNVPLGEYDLTALATDNKGASTLSSAVHVTVTNAPPPPTNYPPIVRISSPANNSTFHAPVNIPIYVYSVDPDGFVAGVEIFAGTNDLGAAQHPCLSADAAGTITNCPTNYFFLVWSNAPLGSYPLTAVATDNVGATKTSEPVNVTILPPPPPPSNRPPVISITAKDPIAIEGTNCWTWVAPTNRLTTWSNWYSGAALPCALITNCGPKSATFVVHRDGSTNNDVTVGYEIGGTATNGIQYMTLPGEVTIPAGEHSAIITVVPIDDGPPEINMTVILKIKISTNYVVGFPQRAAAYILDGPQVRPASEVTIDRCFHLKGDGPDGAWFRIDYTTDLNTWTSLCTNQVVNGSIDFVDPDAQDDGLRYYRAVPQDSAPTQ